MPGKVTSFLRSLLNMSDYMDLEGAGISIRKNIYFRGPNVFILACAIIIASVGLNVNSIPVIIGAMLISPVMGPILGFGFSLGVLDRQLLKDSLANFGVMVVISILASTLYFLLSPLNMEHPTELLARTNPTVYDVLIALFGGFAGILENSRKEKGVVLSGVAIATALMPPLCTIGYGISILNLTYILGAAYLFLINSVFIALATFIGVKYLGYPAVSAAPGARANLTGRAVAVVLLLMIVPSVFSAIDIIRDSNFKIHATRFVEGNKSIGKAFIYDYEVDASTDPSTVTVYLAGERLTGEEREHLYASAAEHGLLRQQVIIRDEATTQKEKISDSEIIRGVLEHSDKQIQALKDSIAILNARLAEKEKLIRDSIRQKDRTPDTVGE
ncbi:MAG: DUF389 domain-containing protein [Bacteroidales bacterium]|nr:DUF389 domain-containing protein [Bacteroidales bacterium]